jgi:hypothetical protein
MHVTTIVKPTDIELHEYRVQNIVDPKFQQEVDRIGRGTSMTLPWLVLGYGATAEPEAIGGHISPEHK